MKLPILISTLILAGTFAAPEASALNEIKSLQQWNADSARLVREGDNLFSVAFDLDLAALDVPGEEALVFTPVLCNGSDSLVLPSVGVYGRNRYYHYERIGSAMITGEDEKVYKNKEKPSRIDYTRIIPYRDWFNGANLVVRAKCYGCCFQLLDQNEKPLGGFMEPDFEIKPQYLFELVEESVTGELSGEARVQFVVDRWELHQDKFGNGPELAKITHSIDTVKNDPDLTITEVWLKGFASPEATWQHNTMLARNRVEALREFVESRYDIDPSLIVTEFQPEDWAGLREWVAGSNIDNREGILAIIDSPVTDPEKDWDAKDRELGRKYPKQRKFLLNTVYPPLRHTEYRIKYRVRRYLDRDEIRRVMKDNPGRLTLNDFNLAAEGYTPGSPEFNEVYDIMVRVHPDSEIANLTQPMPLSRATIPLRRHASSPRPARRRRPSTAADSSPLWRGTTQGLSPVSRPLPPQGSRAPPGSSNASTPTSTSSPATPDRQQGRDRTHEPCVPTDNRIVITIEEKS